MAPFDISLVQDGEIDVDRLKHHLRNLANSQELLRDCLNKGKPFDRLQIELFNKVTDRLKEIVNALDLKAPTAERNHT